MRQFIALVATLLMPLLADFSSAAIAQTNGIFQATLGEPDQKTAEVSTGQLRRILADSSAIVVDTRAPAEFAAGHIPGARGLEGVPAQYLGEVEQMVGGDRTKALVLYCNGPNCQASKRLAEQLIAAGFTNVRRYQLGMPIWRALGGPTEIELEGIARIFKRDATAVYFELPSRR